MFTGRHEEAVPDFHPKVFVSAGKVGFQIELDPADLARTVGGGFSDLV